MPLSRIESLRIKAKLLQKAKNKSGKPAKLKDTMNLIAKVSGYSSWRELKENTDKSSLFMPPYSGAYWKIWYSSYEDAKQHLENHSGYLIPYEKDFFICDEDFIRHLGLSPHDNDVIKTGNDWVMPKDAGAFSNIVKKLSEREKGA